LQGGEAANGGGSKPSIKKIKTYKGITKIN
jgi:hypothetical protein